MKEKIKGPFSSRTLSPSTSVCVVWSHTQGFGGFQVWGPPSPRSLCDFTPPTVSVRELSGLLCPKETEGVSGLSGWGLCGWRCASDLYLGVTYLVKEAASSC